MKKLICGSIIVITLMFGIVVLNGPWPNPGTDGDDYLSSAPFTNIL